ncbi:hypothetical protein M3E18_01300 [Kocuria sp. p3-SID1433]|uniref:hypothetical protein n=1 Tax=unclassified Kocuria TaxID=2649579 RepID=UPI0021A2EA3A|nr:MULTISPECIES: hypothetical protein [unclassified Kocuria]MCT1601265.1 hypothetical protein [Kocuria sp. p3-SID1428]MCT2179193.1 hypothetical protein [Kocuria sp. p3-SID1433]
MAEWLQILTAWATIASALATIGLLFMAAYTAYIALRTLSASQEANHQAQLASARASDQARTDSILRTRPYVFAEILPSITGSASYDLQIRNVGQSAARDVVVKLDRPPKTSDEIASKVLKDLEQKRDLPPGSSLRTYWHLGLEEGNKFVLADGTTSTDPAGLPLEGTIILTYHSDDIEQPTYTERYPFDVNTAGLWPIPEDGINAKSLDPNAKAIHSVLTALSRHIGMLRW